MSSRTLRILAFALALALPGVASGAEIKGVDTSGYPEVRFTVETAKPGTTPPTVLENGLAVAGLEAENMGRALSFVLAVDRSVSMKGEPLTNAVEAARAFVAAKPAADRIAVATFATSPVMLTDFSTSTIDADAALGSLVVDDVQGTTLYDALVMASGLPVRPSSFPRGRSSSSPTETRHGAKHRSTRRSPPRRTQAWRCT